MDHRRGLGFRLKPVYSLGLLAVLLLAGSAWTGNAAARAPGCGAGFQPALDGYLTGAGTSNGFLAEPVGNRLHEAGRSGSGLGSRGASGISFLPEAILSPGNVLPLGEGLHEGEHLPSNTRARHPHLAYTFKPETNEQLFQQQFVSGPLSRAARSQLPLHLLFCTWIT